MKKPGSKTSLHSTLNYMKSTASADARREQSKVSRKSPQTSLNNSSLHRKSSTNSPNIYLNSSKDATERLARTNSLKMRTTSKKKSRTFNKKGSPENLKVERETCSSTLKGSKFPDYLKLGRGGTESGVKVCSYSCCSLNGLHRALLPPIKSFVSARRRALKTERSLKLRPEARPTLSSPNCDELIGRDEPATPNGPNGEGVPDAEMCQIGDLISTAAHVREDFMIKSDDRIFDEISVDEVPQESFDEESLSDLLFEGTKTPRIDPQSSNTTKCCNAMDGVEHNLKEESLPNEEATTEMGNQAPHLSKDCVEVEAVDSAACNTIKHDQDHVENECNQKEYLCFSKDLTNEPYPAECNVANHRNMTIPETEEKSSTRAAVKCEKCDEPRHINPQGLHFLPVEADPEAEKVKLRHQQLDARKNAEEWMVDYALREAVTRISPARQRKVALLVEAFERVLPTSKS